MATDATKSGSSLFQHMFVKVGCAAVAATLIGAPGAFWPTIAFVFNGLISVAPLVIPGIVLAAWVTASGAGIWVARVFNGRLVYTILIASSVGAVTPVCGVTVLPLMAGLLAAGVPLAPIMAFWLSPPITDPAMLAATAATLGVSFAVGKTLAAVAMGMFGGAITALFVTAPWYKDALRQNVIVGNLGSLTCSVTELDPAIWKSAERRLIFKAEMLSVSRLILICLIPAFAAEYALNAVLQPEALTPFIGADRWWAVPLAVFVGAPAYLDGYAALPLARGLIDHGMSLGAAMAFLVSGGVVSIWGAMVIFPVLKLKPFLLYLALAVTGSLASGWVFDLVM